MNNVKMIFEHSLFRQQKCYFVRYLSKLPMRSFSKWRGFFCFREAINSAF